MNLALKKSLYELCEQYVNKKINQAQKGIDDAQKSANSETKSSAGDKYETGRAMMHLEKEKYARQLSESIQLKGALLDITFSKTYETVQSGALIQTSNGFFFMSISAGKLQLNGQTYFAMSIASPIAQVLKGMKKGETTLFRGKNITILDII
jgi:hypothetical protein